MEATQKLPELPAVFYPQQWINDVAIPCEASVSFDAAAVLLSMDAVAFRYANEQVRLPHGRDLDDVGLMAGFSHNGPFEVKIDLQDYLRFVEKLGLDPSGVSAIDDQVLQRLREHYGVESHPGAEAAAPHP